MRLTDHLTLNFNNKMSMVAVFLDAEKAFDTTWHLGLLCKLSVLNFLISLMKLINSYLFQRKLRVSEEGQISASRYIQVGGPHGSVLSPSPIIKHIYK
jgi:hypothetical protein